MYILYTIYYILIYEIYISSPSKFELVSFGVLANSLPLETQLERDTIAFP